MNPGSKAQSPRFLSIGSRLLRVGAVLLVGVAFALASSAQQPGRRRGGRLGDWELATPDSFDRTFQFCRIVFRGAPWGDGGGWGVDFPRADVNFSIRLSELTTARVGMDEAGEPNHLLLRLTDEALFQCPFIMMTEVGASYIDEAEVAQLRTYLQKGGFLWADDFWGSYAWEVWVNEISKVLPPTDYRIVDLPIDHPLFRTHFVVSKVPQIPSINAWAGMGGGTSERGIDSIEPHARAIIDAKGHLLVLITHNTDFGDSWEREADDPEYFYRFSVDGYAVGINVIVYAMTH